MIVIIIIIIIINKIINNNHNVINTIWCISYRFPGSLPWSLWTPSAKTYPYLPYSTPLWNRFGAVFGCVCRLRREMFISQNWLKGWKGRIWQLCYLQPTSFINNRQGHTFAPGKRTGHDHVLQHCSLPINCPTWGSRHFPWTPYYRILSILQYYKCVYIYIYIYMLHYTIYIYTHILHYYYSVYYVHISAYQGSPGMLKDDLAFRRREYMVGVKMALAELT